MLTVGILERWSDKVSLMNASVTQLTIHIELGSLSWAGNAVPAYYHVQDITTGQVHQVATVPSGFNRAALQSVVSRSLAGLKGSRLWSRPTVGVALAVVAFAAFGLVQQWNTRIERAEYRARLAQLPLALPVARSAPAPAPSPAEIVVLDQPYSAESGPSAAQVTAPPLTPAPTLPLPFRGATAQIVHRNVTAVQVPVVKPMAAAVPAKKQDDEPVVLNEGPAGSARVVPVKEQSSTSGSGPKVQAVAVQSPQKELSAPPPSLASTELDVKAVRLVAIADSKTVMVTAPGTRLPVRVALGASLADGRKITKIDPEKGLVALEGGTTLRLE